MKRMILVLGLCVTGCTWYSDGSGLVSGGAADAEWGRSFLIGQSLDAAYACIGNPSSERKREDGGMNTVFSAAEGGSNVSTPISLIGNMPGVTAALAVPASAFSGNISAPFGGGAGNLIIVSDKNHIIRDVNISGSADGISGRDAFIGNRFLRGCHRKFQRSHGQQR
jgi:hypothetical protein